MVVVVCVKIAKKTIATKVSLRQTRNDCECDLSFYEKMIAFYVFNDNGNTIGSRIANLPQHGKYGEKHLSNSCLSGEVIICL